MTTFRPFTILPFVFLAFLAGAVGWVKTHRAPQRQESSVVGPREAWAVAFLAALGNTEPMPDTIAFVVAWQTEENTSARYNPLATSQDMLGATVFNSHGVKNYVSYEQGLEATVRTLSYSYTGYSDILEGLRANNPSLALAGLTASPWAAEAGYGARVQELWLKEETQAQDAPTVSLPKCLPTATGAISAHFHDTSSSYWAGQHLGQHNGTDFSGQPGELVYAPFAFRVEDVQYYSDPGRIGWYIQGRFSDGYLFYAGHLGTVAVQVGETVEACQPIGTIGEVFHVHIKINRPGSPEPCEATGCDDFEEYFNAH